MKELKNILPVTRVNESRLGFDITRTEARQKAIEKAQEIYNSK